MNIFTVVKNQISDSVRIAKLIYDAKVHHIGYSHRHLGNTLDGGFPIFLSDDLVFVKTKIARAPAAIAVVMEDGTKEIYINDAFLKMPSHMQDAAIQHEVGHLLTDAVYTNADRFLGNLGLSFKAYLCECAADDYAYISGYDILSTLNHLYNNYPIYRTTEMCRRIQRLA